MKKFKYSEVTPENIYKKRRSFVKSLGFGLGSLSISSLSLINKISLKEDLDFRLTFSLTSSSQKHNFLAMFASVMRQP